MKKIILIVISLFSLNTLAVSTVYCDSINSESTLTLTIGLTNEISSVRLQVNNALSQSFLARFIHSTQQTSTYSLSGTPDLLVIDNTIVHYGYGRAEINKLIFSCD